MLGLRIKEERERLGLTQPVFAEIAGAKKRTLIDWEKGLSSPTALQLELLAKVGIDVLYVVTGNRSPAAASGQRCVDLTRDEQQLLELFSEASLPLKMEAVRVLSAGLPVREEKVSVKGSRNRVAGRDYKEGK